MYASSWFLTLFLTFLPLPVATRIFDIFMYEVGHILSMLSMSFQLPGNVLDMFDFVYIQFSNLVFHLAKRIL